MLTDDIEKLTPYIQFSREQWAKFRQDTPLSIRSEDLVNLHGKNEVVSLKEIQEVYLPLSRLINLYVTATQQLHEVTGKFLGQEEPRVPYIVGITGSVAVGKSTSSRILKILLERWPNHPRVALLSTDGFLYSNSELKARGLFNKKGFPESYDRKKLLAFLCQAKSGANKLSAPIYSHHLYDITKNKELEIESPNIILVEGLNILQNSLINPHQEETQFISSFFDFTIYVDAEIEIIKTWYLERLLYFYKNSFSEKSSFFHYLSKKSKEEILNFGKNIWQEINEINLISHILPYKNKARLILWKEADHTVQKIFLRKL